eukprot:CAMPEP_0180167170 /NCGR_PEP_ID=MMETSP0986-20121125/31982_1 /TAXON_ID=697907 /ORGANISM="non described non described, Strain CCMP2293" /LENGTH=191 /DNA_ID=CAMNT_0022118439 /DNA_START=75 /DNA_END=647 /DNA_ORIENTATION=+
MTPPMTPIAAPRASRTRGQPVEVDKENMPPASKQLPASSTPIGKGAVPSTPAGKGTPALSSTPQGADAGTASPPRTPSRAARGPRRARLERLYERALGSGGGNEELEVGENKDKESYVALWLRRIMLDPDEGTSYTKFMAKWHIGRKVGAVYILRAMLSPPDKAIKALREGVDQAAQPLKLLQDLHTRVTA